MVVKQIQKAEMVIRKHLKDAFVSTAPSTLISNLDVDSPVTVFKFTCTFIVDMISALRSRSCEDIGKELR